MSKIVYILWKISHTLYRAHIPFVPAIFTVCIRIFFGAVIPYTAVIGKKTCIAYGGPGVVIHRRCKVGKNCYIGPGVVLGGTSGIYDVPIIEDNVFIGVGAKILGAVTIKSNCVIAANAVVVKSVESNCLVGGIPGRVIRHNIDIKKYAGDTISR